MVQHFWEEHGGRVQPVLMRITSKHLVALERQVRESVKIEKCTIKAEECLNLKNEWAGSKIPGLRVSKPKGVASTSADVRGMDMSLVLEAALRRGVKRLDYILENEDEESREEVESETESEIGNGGRKEEGREDRPPRRKRQREAGIGDGWEKTSPIKWKASPLGKTFASINAGIKGRKMSAENQPSKEGSRQTAERMTPVRTKVQRIELIGKRRKEGGSLQTQSPGQKKISCYLKRLQGPKGPKQVLETSRQHSSMQIECPTTRASPGTQRMPGKAKSTSNSSP